MKNGKKPNRTQRELIEYYGLNPTNWQVVKDTSEYMTIVDTFTGKQIRELPKVRCIA